MRFEEEAFERAIYQIEDTIKTHRLNNDKDVQFKRKKESE